MKGEAVLITGATGLVGEELTRTLVEAGYTVYALSRNLTKAESLKQKVQAEYAEKVLPIAADLSSDDLEAELDRQFRANGLYPNHLINNARDLGNLRVGADGRVSTTSWLSEFNLGVVTAYRLAHYLQAKASGFKSIVSIASQYGVVASNLGLYDEPEVQSPPHYGVVKAALIHLTKELAVRYAAAGVRVNTISYGGIEGRAPQDFKEKYAKLNPIGRMLKKEELSAPVLFLLSPSASAVTGHNLIVDGGWTVW